MACCFAMNTPTKIVVRINADLQWRYTVGKGGNYVAVCDPLQLTLQAETWAELMEDTSEVLNSIFHDLLDSNELDRFLRDKGWSLANHVPNKTEDVQFDVPFLFAPEMANSNGSQRHLPQ